MIGIADFLVGTTFEHSNQELPSTRLRLLRERGVQIFLFHCNEYSSMRRSLSAKQSKGAFNNEFEKIQSRGYFRGGGGYLRGTPLHLGHGTFDLLPGPFRVLDGTIEVKDGNLHVLTGMLHL